jgi:hypothetical protein
VLAASRAAELLDHRDYLARPIRAGGKRMWCMLPRINCHHRPFLKILPFTGDCVYDAPFVTALLRTNQSHATFGRRQNRNQNLNPLVVTFSFWRYSVP